MTISDMKLKNLYKGVFGIENVIERETIYWKNNQNYDYIMNMQDYKNSQHKKKKLIREKTNNNNNLLQVNITIKHYIWR